MVQGETGTAKSLVMSNYETEGVQMAPGLFFIYKELSMDKYPDLPTSVENYADPMALAMILTYEQIQLS